MLKLDLRNFDVPIGELIPHELLDLSPCLTEVGGAHQPIHFGHDQLALLATFLVLNRILRRRHPELDFGPLRLDFLRSFAATAAMGAAAWGAMRWAGPLLPTLGATTLGTRALPLGLAIAVAMAVYFGTTRLMGMRDAISLLRRRR